MAKTRTALVLAAAVLSAGACQRSNPAFHGSVNSADPADAATGAENGGGGGTGGTPVAGEKDAAAGGRGAAVDATAEIAARDGAATNVSPDAATDGATTGASDRPAVDFNPGGGGRLDALFDVASARSFSLRFFGNGTGSNDIDRVKIRIDAPERPIDVGGDFTIELWIKARLQDNPSVTCKTGHDNWLFGNIFVDRDIFGNSDYGEYGLSIGQGRVMFGMVRGSNGNGLCGKTVVADGLWHHIAATRHGGTGRMTLFVDGKLDGEVDAPNGDISYRNGRPSSMPNSDPYLVLGAQKHGPSRISRPAYDGLIDELRISKAVRYPADFTPTRKRFVPDALTVGLYHFDEGDGTTVQDSSGAAGGPSDGTLMVGAAGSPPGPAFSPDVPF